MTERALLNATGQPMTHRERFLFERRSGIGGSDVAAIMGFSKWKTAHSVWEDKLGISDDGYDNDLMLWGRLLEPVIRHYYAERNGVHVYEMNSPLRNADFPELVANADGAVAINAGDQALKGLEIKTARRMDDWGGSNTDEIPYAYLLQVNHYMLVAGVDQWDVAVLFSGSMYRQYTIHANKALQDLIYEACAEFWNNHVKTGIAPPPQSYDDCVKRWGTSANKGEVFCGIEQERAAAEIVRINAELKALEAAKKEHQFILTERLRDRGDTLVTPDGRVIATWKQPEPSIGFDLDEIVKNHPEICAPYQIEKEASRRLLARKQN